MSNVVPIDNARIERDQRIREISQRTVMRNLIDYTAMDESHRADELRVYERDRLRSLLQRTMAQLAVHDSPAAMIQFAAQIADMYRMGGCKK